MRWPWSRRVPITLPQLRKLFNWSVIPEEELVAAYRDMEDATNLETEAISRFKKRKG